MVSKEFKTDEPDIQQGTIDGGKYAVFILEHTVEDVQKVWKEIFPQVLSQGYKLDHSRYIIERYAMKIINKNKCEICVPIC